MKIVPYYRVSTARQGVSGLGLDAQQSAVEAYARANQATLLAAYTEVESGKNNHRPQLRAALLHAKRAKATLVVAKLDRLARNLAFLANLIESEVQFVCCDNPQANRLTLHILAVVAENEARAISERTKVALSAAKARGTKLGSAREGHWDKREDARRRGALTGNQRSGEIRGQLAERARAEVAPIILALRAEGLTLQEIANRLNGDGWTTRRGNTWGTASVCRVLQACTVNQGEAKT